MARPPFPASFRRLLLPAVLALLAGLGCKGNGNGGNTLYVFDGSTQTVEAWDDINTVLAATTVAAPDRTITSSLLSGVTLAWGGLVDDTVTNQLYLVSESGNLYIITQASTQKGAITATNDIIQISLGNTSDHFASGAFGQASLDQNNNILYVLETSLDGSQTRVWYVSQVNSLQNSPGAVVPVAQTFSFPNDTWGVGVTAVTGGEVIGLFGGGSPVYQSLNATPFTGPRMWLGQNFAFPSSFNGIVQNDVIIGPGAIQGFTGTVNYGSLAYDFQKSSLYAFGQGSPEVAVFNLTQFETGFNQAPARSLGDPTASLASLRVLSHPFNGDWLLGANFTVAPSATSTGTGGADLLIWKTPSAGGSAVSVSLPGPTTGSTPEIRGMMIGN